MFKILIERLTEILNHLQHTTFQLLKFFSAYWNNKQNKGRTLTKKPAVYSLRWLVCMHARFLAQCSSELFWSPADFKQTSCPWNLCLYIFTFSSFPEPLGQFQPIVAQSILGWREFKFVQIKGHALFKGEIITK